MASRKFSPKRVSATEHAAAMMTNIRPLGIAPSVLPTVEESTLCKDYLMGHCFRKDQCTSDHTMCRLVGNLSAQQEANTILYRSKHAPNFLSLAPRVRTSGSIFDSDGPGHLSHTRTSRHDNDHVDIRNIQILPTTDEVLALRAPFVPSKDVDLPHLFPSKDAQLLQTLFRQSRYDSTESLIDCSYFAAQSLVKDAPGTKGNAVPLSYEYHVRQETPKGNRCALFRDVAFEDVHFLPNKGINLRVSYACPSALQRGKIHTAGVLETGTLVALVGLDKNGFSLSVTFMEVHLRESTDGMLSRGGKGRRAAVQLTFAQPDNQEDVRRILQYSQSVMTGSFALVEFPNVLLAGFSHCLKQMQRQMDSPKLPFAEHIIPTRGQQVALSPPEYAMSDGFTFDLTSIQNQADKRSKQQFRLGPLKSPQELSNATDALQQIKERTTLDEGQAQALLETLNRSFAFTQGPPGTGKTFLGVALAKTILASQQNRPTKPKPILVACMTNHALDSYLADLDKAGVKKIARLGRGTKEAWIKPLQIGELTGKMNKTGRERGLSSKYHMCSEGLITEATRWCESLNASELSWHAVRDLLKAHYKDIHDQFAALDIVEKSHNEYRTVRKLTGFGYQCWATGHDIASLQKLTTELAEYINPKEKSAETAQEIESELAEMQSLLQELIVSSNKKTRRPVSGKNVWDMSPPERQELVTLWKGQLQVAAGADTLAEIHARHYKAVQEKIRVREETEARCLAEQQVIGLTTTACAKYWPLLSRLNLNVVMCEEAGEVMEPHTLCTLLPSIQHAIFIGDPLQLRPHTNEQSLSLETEIGSRYRLDESLFERMMQPHDKSISPLPFSQLNMQRRMHPDIADVCRATLYPFLKDHPSTTLHPRVVGMIDRTWWLDHKHTEDASDPSSTLSKSFSNKFEVDMVAGLVDYLLSQNEYHLGDIAILTPYNGQLAQLKERFQRKCPVFLNAKDREALYDDDLITEEEAKSGHRLNVEMTNLLRLATVDNFQGEEAKVVILSTVRSNADNRVGFMKTQNRINVAVSRARDGLYIIGNASCMKSSGMWSEIIALHSQKRRIGSSFGIYCQRHPHRCRSAARADDFKAVKDCDVPCGGVLQCGHVCGSTCHPWELHSQMTCLAECTKVHAGCGHRCQRQCGEPCGACDVQLDPVWRLCGHNVPRHCGGLVDAVVDDVCRQVSQVALPCGHPADVVCGVSAQPVQCTACEGGASLPSGAACARGCGSPLCRHLPAKTLSTRVEMLSGEVAGDLRRLEAAVVVEVETAERSWPTFGGLIRPSPVGYGGAVKALSDRRKVLEAVTAEAEVGRKGAGKLRIMAEEVARVVPGAGALAAVPLGLQEGFERLVSRCREEKRRDLRRTGQLLVDCPDPRGVFPRMGKMMLACFGE
ncbi:MAG: hypothetical protein M1833_001737 [Piccolia ochrophora]|nr:MAG: hypothetical protein M1833_001737 [Piccolia ochrophora]